MIPPSQIVALVQTASGDLGEVGQGLTWGGRTGTLLLVSGLWSTGYREKTQTSVSGREQPSTMLELRRPGGPIEGARAPRPPVPHAAASRPDSRRRQPHGQNRSFGVDAVKLQQRHQQLQRLVRPDFFSQRSQLNRKNWLARRAELLKETILKKPRNS